MASLQQKIDAFYDRNAPDYQEKLAFIGKGGDKFGRTFDWNPDNSPGFMIKVMEADHANPGVWRYYSQALDEGFLSWNDNSGTMELTAEGGRAINDETRNVFQAGGFLTTNPLDTNEDNKVDVKDITDTTATDAEPDTTYTRPQELQNVIDEIDKVLGAGIPDSPEYQEVSPDKITEHYNKLTEMEKPIEAESLKTVNEQYNFLNPYGLGSGKQVKMGADVVQDLSRDRYSRATGIATSENDKAYRAALNKWNYLTAKYERAIDTQMAIGQFETGAKQFGQGLDYQTWAKGVERGWLDRNAIRERQWQTEDKEDERRFSRELAEMYKPKEPNFMDYLSAFASPVLTGLGYGFGGGWAKNMFSPKTKTG